MQGFLDDKQKLLKRPPVSHLESSHTNLPVECNASVKYKKTGVHSFVPI